MDYSDLSNYVSLVINAARLNGGLEDYTAKHWLACWEAHHVVSRNMPRIISVYGVPKMGKSTLLNSIVGEGVLPVSVTPMTGTVINLYRRPYRGGQVYVSLQKDGHVVEDALFDNAACACGYLARVAGQNSDYEAVNIESGFPNARSFFTETCSLRDTPGAISGKPVSAELDVDSRRSLASIREVFFSVFCAAPENISQKGAIALYREHLAYKPNLHIITRCDEDDMDEADRAELREEFHKNLANGAMEDIVCTGMQRSGATFLARADMDRLDSRLSQMTGLGHAEYLLKCTAEDILRQWDRYREPWRLKGAWRVAIQNILNP